MGAKKDEIEVTPAMAEAGCREAALYDRDDPKAWEVAAVYRAMELIRRHGTGSSFGKAISPSCGPRIARSKR